MENPIKLRARGTKTKGLSGRTLGRITFEPVPKDERGDCFLVVRRFAPEPQNLDLSGYATILVEAGAEAALKCLTEQAIPCVVGYDDLDFLSPDTIVAVNPANGVTSVLYRADSTNNSIFATGRCNSNCIMCSQPPQLSDDNSIIEEHLRLIDLIREPPELLGITGGEPTLLGEGLVQVLVRLKERFPDTHVHMLTNGRFYAYRDLVQAIAGVAHRHFLSAIPLYADIASEHDYIVQARGAFDQTMQGLYNAARERLQIEIRVVLHRQTIPRLVALMEFIYRNLPFVSHVALMGLENMGYVKKNWGLLWDDPLDYAETLEQAVEHLFYRRVPVSVYNLPLCVLPRSLWPFARQSISDYKNIYLDECQDCGVRTHCAGLFTSGKDRHSRGIRAIRIWEGAVSAIFESPTSYTV